MVRRRGVADLEDRVPDPDWLCRASGPSRLPAAVAPTHATQFSSAKFKARQAVKTSDTHSSDRYCMGIHVVSQCVLVRWRLVYSHVGNEEIRFTMGSRLFL